MILINPDCRDGKHRNCAGDGWDTEREVSCGCPCDCHNPELQLTLQDGTV